MTMIKHQRFDDNGKLIEEYEVDVKTNETETEIILTDELFRIISGDLNGICSFKSVYTGYEKKVTYNGREVTEMRGGCDGRTAEIVLEYKDGNTTEFFFVK